MNFEKKIKSLQMEWQHTPRALVTGGSSGMGLQYATLLAKSGCNLLIVSNQKEELEKVSTSLSEQYGVEVLSHYADLSLERAADDLFAYCETQNLSVDILINNAGVFFFKELETNDLPKVELMLKLHILTVTRLCVLFGRAMKSRGSGFMLNVSSMAAVLPMPGITIYAATKAYLKSFGKSYYFEMRPYGVGMTTVCPAAIATPLYNLKPQLMNFGVKIGVIGTPEWLVRRALRGMFRKRRVVKPGFMNVYLPPLIAILPNCLVNRIWKKIK